MYFCFALRNVFVKYSFTGILFASYTLATCFGCKCDYQAAVSFICTMLNVCNPSKIESDFTHIYSNNIKKCFILFVFSFLLFVFCDFVVVK